MRTKSLPVNFSTEEFISNLKRREEQAVTAVVRAYTQHLYRAALGAGFQETAARELVQDVWDTFFEALARFEGRSHVRTFLFGIFYNKAAERRRDDRRHAQEDPIEAVVEERFDERGNWIHPVMNPEEFAEAVETKEMIEKCLEGLPFQQRMAFTLKEMDEEETSHICKILEVTVTNLGVLLYRARNRLRECLEKRIKEDQP